MDICKQLDDIDPCAADELPVTVGCVFGSIVDVPIMQHQNEITGEWCETCGYHHPNEQHEIPMHEAVETCKRISAGLPSEDARARIWQRIGGALKL